VARIASRHIELRVLVPEAATSIFCEAYDHPFAFACQRTEAETSKRQGWRELRTPDSLMKKVSLEVSEPKRESSLTRSRSVAAAGSLLLDWTDFGRLFVTLP
jgi:hypothetical protein